MNPLCHTCAEETESMCWFSMFCYRAVRIPFSTRTLCKIINHRVFYEDVMSQVTDNANCDFLGEILGFRFECTTKSIIKSCIVAGIPFVFIGNYVIISKYTYYTQKIRDMQGRVMYLRENAAIGSLQERVI